MKDNTVQSEFEREVETYREAMDNLHRKADDQRASYDGLDTAMGSLEQSIAEMSDAVANYDCARNELDAAVVSLGEHAEESRSVSTRDASTAGGDPVAGD